MRERYLIFLSRFYRNPRNKGFDKLSAKNNSFDNPEITILVYQQYHLHTIHYIITWAEEILSTIHRLMYNILGQRLQSFDKLIRKDPPNKQYFIKRTKIL